MKNFKLSILIITILISYSCGNEKIIDIPKQNEFKITSEEFIDNLLFANTNDYQIKTSEPATFSSSDPFTIVSSTGVIKRITSGEVVVIDIISTTNPANKLKIFALGARDDNYDPTNVFFNGLEATDSYASYLQGWKTLSKLPVINETYAMILRHADADQGVDFENNEGPQNWWKSCDSKLARQLSDKGKERAVELGKIFKDLKYPIERVISSEFCRARETAQLINAGPPVMIDGRINHPSYNVAKVGGLFPGMIQLMKEQPVDNKMTLVEAHHPINELRDEPYPTFPNVIPFPWTGGYFIKISSDKTITFQGAISYPMIKYFRDLKLKKL